MTVKAFDFGLRDATVCISGATMGLGRVTALAYAREGARIVVTARGAERLARVVEELRAAGAREAFGVQTDAGSLDSINALFEQIDARWGQLNALINMVGANVPSEGRTFIEVPDADWQYFFQVGVMSVVRCTRAAVPLLRKAEWGRVVNISSISSRVGMPFEAPYMTAKAALNALSKNMAWALARDGILVNTVTPGVYHTEGLRNYMENTGVTAQYDPDSLEEIYHWMTEQQGGRCAGAIGRIALPDEIVPLIMLLGSRATSYLVGANIAADGGTDFSVP